MHNTTEEILKRIPTSRVRDVILLDEKDWKDNPFGLNVLECGDPRDRKEVHDSLEFTMHLFERIFNVTPDRPMVSDYLRAVTLTLLKNPGTTLADISHFFRNRDFRVRLLQNVDSEEVQAFWETYDELKDSDQLNQSSYILNKVRAFVVDEFSRSIFGQAKSTIDFQDIIENRKILILKMHSGQLLDMIATTFTARILKAALNRESTPEHLRLPFFIYLDEFQNLQGIEDISTLIEEARKYNISLLVAHQNRDQLSHRNKATLLNVPSKIFFRVSGKDADELAKECDTSPQMSYEVGGTHLEQKKVLVREVLDWLYNHPHDDDRVNMFVKSLEEYIRLSNQLPREGTPDASSSSTSTKYNSRGGVSGFTQRSSNRPGRSGNEQQVWQAKAIVDWISGELYHGMATGDTTLQVNNVPVKWLYWIIVGFDSTNDLTRNPISFLSPEEKQECGLVRVTPIEGENGTYGRELIEYNDSPDGLGGALHDATKYIYISDPDNNPRAMELWKVAVARQEQYRLQQLHTHPLFIQMLQGLQTVKTILARYPVYTTGGQFEEVGRLLEPSQVEARTAARLTKLPKFTALAMLDGKQVDIPITPLPSGRSFDAYLRVLAFVRQQTRDYYTKPYTMVIEEIARRRHLETWEIEEEPLLPFPNIPTLSDTIKHEKKYTRRGN